MKVNVDRENAAVEFYQQLPKGFLGHRGWAVDSLDQIYISTTVDRDSLSHPS